MKIASATHKGVVRATNQDAYGAGELPGGVIYAVVCDGMGGANGGNIASELSVKTIVDQINASYRMGMSSNSVRRMIETAVNAANIVVFDMANAGRDGNDRGLRSTELQYGAYFACRRQSSLFDTGR